MIDDDRIKSHLDRVVRGSVEETLNALPHFYFYLPPSAPSEYYPHDLPRTIDSHWKSLSSQDDIDSGKFVWTLQTYLHLKADWTVQTYLHLRADGFPCELASSLPSEGIVLAHRDFFPDDLKPGPKILLVCILADREGPGLAGRHPYAQLHVVQNPRDPRLTKPTKAWPAYYMPYWPQPGLIPRDSRRRDRFEVAAYFGHEDNLAPELRSASWRDCLHDLGLAWRLVPRERWHDHSDVDVVVAVRSFDQNDYPYKPPSKLHNAWHAGIPAVLGRESAYQASRKRDLDYLEVSSVDDVVSALKRLRDDPDLRRAMAENGHVRAAETTPNRLVGLWRDFLLNEAVPAYEKWRTAPRSGRSTFMMQRHLARHRELRRHL